MMKKEVEKLKIIVDDREPNQMVKYCEAFGLDVQIKRLKVGDYVYEEKKIAIERKQIDDFCGSIMDGRIKKQVKRMKAKYTHNYVLVCGFISNRHNKNFKENCILGKMASLITKHNVNVIMLENDMQLAYMVERIFTNHAHQKVLKEIKEIENDI